VQGDQELAMTNDQLMGKYGRLRQELADAYAEPVWSNTRHGRIERLVQELEETERQLAMSDSQFSPASTLDDGDQLARAA
jgi:hypothetical protein